MHGSPRRTADGSFGRKRTSPRHRQFAGRPDWNNDATRSARAFAPRTDATPAAVDESRSGLRRTCTALLTSGCTNRWAPSGALMGTPPASHVPARRIAACFAAGSPHTRALRCATAVRRSAGCTHRWAAAGSWVGTSPASRAFARRIVGGTRAVDGATRRVRPPPAPEPDPPLLRRPRRPARPPSPV